MSRTEFTKSTKRAALARSGMKCEAIGADYGLEPGQRCGADLNRGVEFHHMIGCYLGGDNSLENCVCACIPCHRHITAKVDKPRAAKTVRQSDKHHGISRSKAKIQSRGFAKAEKQRAPKQGLPPRRLYERIE